MEEQILAVFWGLPGKVRALMMPRIYDIVFTSSRVVGVPRDRVPKSVAFGGVLAASITTIALGEMQREQPVTYNLPFLNWVLQIDGDAFAVTYPELRKARVYTGAPGYVLMLKDAQKTGNFSVLRKEEANAMKRLLGQLAAHAFR